MGSKTGISWTGWTWNFCRGCTEVTPGCANCYAKYEAHRLNLMSAAQGRLGPYVGLVKLGKDGKVTWTGDVRIVPEKLIEPLKRKTHDLCFVASMSDPLHRGFDNRSVAAGFGIMAAARHQTFQYLTKRIERAPDWFTWLDAEAARRFPDVAFDARAMVCWQIAEELFPPLRHSTWSHDFWLRAHEVEWPLPNVWIGCSVEDQKRADDRVGHLLSTPAAVRFLSCEPLLGAVDLEHVHHNREVEINALAGTHGVIRPHRGRGAKVDWLIAGCESGKRARGCEVDWLRGLRDQCEAHGTAFFLKQAEESADLGVDGLLDAGDDDAIAFGDGSKLKRRIPGGNHVVELPYLDGVQHAAFPAVAR